MRPLHAALYRGSLPRRGGMHWGAEWNAEGTNVTGKRTARERGGDSREILCCSAFPRWEASGNSAFQLSGGGSVEIELEAGHRATDLQG